MQGKIRSPAPLTATAIVLAAIAMAFAAERFLPVVRVAENWSRDLRVATLTAPRPQSDRIVVVAITEESLAPFPYRSPLDRHFLSRLLLTLDEKGARIIGLDILLDQPSERIKDEALRNAMHEVSAPLVVASAEALEGITERQAAFAASFLQGVETGIPAVIKDPLDGVVRAVALRSLQSSRPRPGFVSAIAQRLNLPIPNDEVLHLRYRGAPDADTRAFPVYPAHRVALLPDEWLDGRIVLVGSDLTFTDRHRTPFSVLGGPATGDMPGVLIQAHALSQLLEGASAPQLSSSGNLAVIALLAALGFAIAAGFSRPFTIALAIAGTCGILWTAGLVGFRYAGWLVSLVGPTLALMLASGLTYAWRWRLEHVKRRYIERAFSKYVSPAVVDQIIADPERLTLGGERRETTFLFTDIAEYTNLTESTEPATLVEIMNGYFDGTCEIVIAHEGTIEKIVGDALHVMFNAPLDQPDHAKRAVACALALDAFCQAFAERQRERGIAFGVTRIGVNTGETVVGNFGGEKFFDYSATGDAINIAARLESVNKHLGTRICVSATTAHRCPGIVFRPIGELVLKGKTESVAAFEPIDADAERRDGLDGYLSAYRLLSARDPKAAIEFSELAARNPHDALIQFHARRLESGETGSRIVMKDK